MADLKEVEQALNTYVRPLTFPLALKMLKSEDEIPDRTRRPFQQMKKKVAICQGIGMARKLGWTIAMGKEDMQCSLGAAPFGFFKNIDFYNDGNLAAGMFTASKEIGKTEEDLIDRFDYGLYSHILVAPLNRAGFEPDMLMMYGNPAQIMRLVHGALYNQGGAVQSSAMGRLGCATIITAMKNDECRYLLPGNGDRIFGMTQDYEMSFLIPASKIDTVLDGLGKTHKGGIRYPITSFFNFQAAFPPSYQEQMKIWEEEGDL
ncbi:MAG: DUF169 domain-containing protein [Deltaproteobacteria bacterium]|uniref:DUF169 domain-containing protein n=1 Tax=Candidatus Desulfacyla euxinica TaxID=2841693 RepID=A0A8J6N0B9_9DELT|nr:DUF169 domain-containing protein [Candidatus Desulfacyla euxinica]